MFLLSFATTEALAAIAFRSIESLTYQNRTNPSIAAPAGVQNGDLLIILFAHGTGGAYPAVPTPPAGFTIMSAFPVSLTDGGFYLRAYGWYKIANNESGNYTITSPTANTQVVIAAFSGVDPTTPFSPASTAQQGTGSTSTSPGLTTTANGSMLLFWASDWGDTTNVLSGPAGTTPAFTRQYSVALFYLSTGVLATAGATGNKSITSNSNGTNPWAASLMSLNPAPSCTVPATADLYRVPTGGACYTITGPNAVCKYVRNNAPAALDILVPTKTTAEWTGFYNNLPSGVTADTCP